MDVIEKVYKSTNTIKQIYKDEYDTSQIPGLSINEIKKLYELNTDENIYTHLSGCPACCFSIPHNVVSNCNLHIIYYNFPIFGEDKTTKINKRSFIDKINKMYEDEIFNQIDSVLIILNENLTEKTLEIANIITKLLHENPIDLTNTNKELKSKNVKLEFKHFRNVFIFDVKTLMINILEHDYIPKHEVIRDIDEINHIAQINNCKLDQFPIILKNDAIAKLKLSTKKDLIKITRNSRTTGEYIYYRIVS